MKVRLVMKCAALLAPLALLLCVADSAIAASRAIEAGAKWEVTETTTLTELTIGEGATITAPQGRTLTMTVDGVEMPVKSGTYKGNIVLTLAESIVKAYDGMGTKANFDFRTAVYINNGAYIPGQSVAAAQIGGTPGN